MSVNDPWTKLSRFIGSHWKIGGIKEAVHIRKTGPHMMNRDWGRHKLPDVYSGLLTLAQDSSDHDHSQVVEIYMRKKTILPCPYTEWTLSVFIFTKGQMNLLGNCLVLLTLERACTAQIITTLYYIMPQSHQQGDYSRGLMVLQGSPHSVSA